MCVILFLNYVSKHCCLCGPACHTLKNTHFAPTSGHLKLFSSVPEKLFVLVKFDNVWLIIFYRRWSEKKESGNLRDELWEGAGVAASKAGCHRPVTAPKPKEKPVSGLPVGGQQRGITALCSSQTQLLGAKTIRQLVQGDGHIPVALFQNI